MNSKPTLLLLVGVAIFATVPLPRTADAGCAEYLIKWTAYSGAPPTVLPGSYPPTNTFQLLERTEHSGGCPRYRDTRPTRDELTVIARNSAGGELWRVHTVDPRIVRAEHLPQPSTIYHRSLVEFTVPVPSEMSVHRLEFYDALPFGDAMGLSTLGELITP